MHSLPHTCGASCKMCVFEVNMHPIMSLSGSFALLSQQRNGLGGTGRLVRGVGGLAVALLVPSSGKTADYGS